MCGICGMVDFSGAGIDAQTLARMTVSLRHRGPDDSGTLVSSPAGLGHTRLSIIDLSAQGHQPMTSDDGTLAIVYNGEIYNFPELKRGLEAQGVAFRTRSDTELALSSSARRDGIWVNLYEKAVGQARNEAKPVSLRSCCTRPLRSTAPSTGTAAGLNPDPSASLRHTRIESCTRWKTPNSLRQASHCCRWPAKSLASTSLASP